MLGIPQNEFLESRIGLDMLKLLLIRFKFKYIIGLTKFAKRCALTSQLGTLKVVLIRPLLELSGGHGWVSLHFQVCSGRITFSQGGNISTRSMIRPPSPAGADCN